MALSPYYWAVQVHPEHPPSQRERNPRARRNRLTRFALDDLHFLHWNTIHVMYNDLKQERVLLMEKSPAKGKEAAGDKEKVGTSR